MVTKSSVEAKLGKPFILGLIIGSAVSVMLTILFAAVISALMVSGKIKPSAMAYSVMGALMLSSVIGAIVANTQIKGKQMIASILTAACYFGELLCITALFLGGIYEGIGATALVIFGGGAIAALLPAGKGRTGKIRRYKKIYS